MKKQLIVLAVALLSSGCSYLNRETLKTTDYEDQRYSHIDERTEKLLGKISKSLSELSESRNGYVFSQSTLEQMKLREWQTTVVPTNFGIPVSISEFVGHPQTILSLLGQLTDYELVTIGKKPANIRNVYVDVRSRPAIEVLRSVAWQLGCDALIEPISKNRKLIIDYSYKFKDKECSNESS